jgi:hypothetical protein
MVSDTFRRYLAILSWRQSTPFFMFSSRCETPKKMVNRLSCPILMILFPDKKVRNNAFFMALP